MMIIDFENIPIYGIFLLLSLFINCIVIFVLGKVQNIKSNIILCSLTFEMIGIISGAKVLNIIQTGWKHGFYYAGFSAYGGVVGGVASLIGFSKAYKVSLHKMLSIYVPLLPLLYSISKMGCFLSGCCYGIEYCGIGSVTYGYSNGAPINISLFPVQLVESIVNLIIYVYIMVIYIKNKDDINIIGYVFLLCGVSKFILEFFRASWEGGISSTQCISIFFIICGLFIIFNWRKNEKK